MLSGGQPDIVQRHSGSRSMLQTAQAARSGWPAEDEAETGSAAPGMRPAGLAALAAMSVGVTMALTSAPTGASVRTPDVTAEAPNERRRGSDTPSPAKLDQGSLISAGAAAQPAKIGDGFAPLPAFGPQSLGLLADDISKPVAYGPFERTAALGKRTGGTSYSSTRLSGNISTSGKSTSCLPGDLRRVLNEAAAKFGHIRITSTSRSRSHNRRVGGAPRSLHLECRAVDFNYHGSRRGALIKFLRSHWAVGGLGIYGSGHIHIDDGPHRTW